jgi:hypothetical protein
LLSTTYRFSIKNLWFISQGFEFRFNKYVRFSALFTLIINKYFLAKLLRQILRINSIEFRANQFKKFVISQFNF